MEEQAGNYVHSGLHRQNRLRFSVDNIDGRGKKLFHATAMSVCQAQRQATMNNRAYLTDAQHPDSYLLPTNHHYRWHGCCA